MSELKLDLRDIRRSAISWPWAGARRRSRCCAPSSSNAGLHWGDRIDALVNLKIALGAAGDRRPVPEFITPEMEAAIFEAVQDDDYLVRYHAADSLLKASGEKKELSEHKELFSYICGKYPGNEKPGDEERAGFRKAAEILRRRLRKSS